jgi:hypothetical protein
MARIFDLLIPVGTAILSVRLFAAGLHRRYRVFFYYLIFETLHLGVLAALGVTSGAYQKVWVLTEPIDWLFYVVVVLEVYALVLEDYRGLSTVGRWFLIGAVLLALLASGISLMAPSRYNRQGLLMTYYFVAERAVYLSLLIFLISILIFLMQYPVTLSRNIIVHSMVFSIYFLGNTVIYQLLSMRGYESIPAVTYALVAISLAAIGAWLVLMSRAGEVRKASLRPHWMPGREEELVSQLNNLNTALLRATRK